MCILYLLSAYTGDFNFDIFQLLIIFSYLAVNCWPSVSGNDTYVSIEYEASAMSDLQNVVISVPLPALREAPNVTQIEGDWR